MSTFEERTWERGALAGGAGRHHDDSLRLAVLHLAHVIDVRLGELLAIAAVHEVDLEEMFDESDVLKGEPK